MGQQTCVVRGCPSKTGQGLSLFKLPNDRIRAQLWLEACYRTDLLPKTTLELRNYRMCELHFANEHILQGGYRKTLFDLAMPTKFSFGDGHNPSRKTVVSGSSENDEAPCQSLEPSTVASVGQPEASANFPSSSPTGSTTLLYFSDTDEEICQLGLSPVLPPFQPGRSTNVQISTPTDQNYPVIEIYAEDSISTPLPPSSVSTQTSQKLTCCTPRKQKLRLKIKALRRKLNKAHHQPQEEQTCKWTLKNFKDMCDKFLTKSLATFVKSQLVLNHKMPLSRRYSDEYKQFALTLYFLEPRAYSLIEKLINLPSKGTIRKITKGLVSQPGLRNERLFEAIQIKAKTMLEQDKHCSVIIDEVALKSHLYFDTGRDEIIGLCDTGVGKKDQLIAEKAVVIMARGLNSNWKLPLAYFFVNSEFGPERLLPDVKKCIGRLFDCGLHVDCLISDASSDFIKFSKLLGITSDNPEFQIGDKRLVYLFDPGDLMKATRNNLINNTFYFDGKTTSWAFVEIFYNEDKKQIYRSSPKLTDAHINPTTFEKTQVKLATQVLSGTVACSMNAYVNLTLLPQDAVGTVEFIGKFDKLFDILNSADLRNSNPYKTVFEGSDFQIDFLEEMLEFINNIRIFDRNGKDVTSRSRSRKCWIVTINGVKMLWNRLSSSGFKYLRCRRINQDCFENVFRSTSRQGHNSINPHPIQFQRTFKKLFCQSYLHSNKTNHADDIFDELLLNLKSVPSKTKISESQQQEPTFLAAISLPDVDYREEPDRIRYSFDYVCEYLIRKSINVHSCGTCVRISREKTNLDVSCLLTYFKTNRCTFGGPTALVEQFVIYIYELEELFCSMFETISTGPHVSNSLLHQMKNVVFEHPCKLFPLQYVIKLFIRLKIFYTLKYCNKDLKTKKKQSNREPRKITVLSHL